MLNENIKALRKSKGLSQQDLADKLNVVRQTISKWEQGLSVPDSDLLIALSEALETPVSTLLGETVTESEADQVKALSEKLEIINLQFARRKAMRRSALHWLLIAVCLGILAVAAILVVVNSPYLGWDYSAPETAVMGVAIHAFEWAFVRLAPFILIAAIIGVCFTRKKFYPVLDMNYSISVCLYNIAKSAVCFCRTNLVSIIEVANPNVKQRCPCLDCGS